MAEIKIENLKYRYPDTKELALDGITCDIKPGEFIGVIGRNGQGKYILPVPYRTGAKLLPWRLRRKSFY